MVRLIQGIHFAAIAAMGLLTFIWPLAISADPAHPGFKVAAIAAAVAFFVSLAVLLAARIARRR